MRFEILMTGTVVLLILLSGCFSGVKDQRQEDEPKEPFSLPSHGPMVLNETVENNVWMEFHQGMTEEDCVFRQGTGDESYKIAPRVVFVQYDRYGLQQETTRPVDPDAPIFHFNFTLAGEPPYLAFVNRNYCFEAGGQTHGVIDGFGRIANFGSENSTLGNSHYYGNVTVQKDETYGFDTWTPPKTWHNWNGMVFQVDWEGNMWGTMRILDSEGFIWAEDRFDIMGRQGTGQSMTRGSSGDYTIELELSEPALTDTRWSYRLGYSEFREPVCQYGFEWPFLCT